ncbi:hypothetical protein ACFOOJ_21080 [Sphingobium xenophagum]|uniref:hypothetical protein n=1 Tax=Sphingobium xenophagum TaxID=121428 RepID=UPI0012FD12EC|nr:hypothetical protein [Sphingobium xenophagum]
MLAITILLEACGTSSGESGQVTPTGNSLSENRQEEERSIRELQKAKEQLKSEIEALKTERNNYAKSSGTVSETSPAPPQNMCYKDYCPCEGEQGGPDMTLCDQLEQGIAVDVRMMIAGRSMREVRRQLATGDY